MGKIINSFRQQRRRQNKRGEVEDFFKRKRFVKHVAKEPISFELLLKDNNENGGPPASEKPANPN